MAAEVLASAGVQVDVYDAMPSVGRKFLLAGKGGLNLTHSEAPDAFAGRYGARREVIESMLREFGATEVRAWAHGFRMARERAKKWKIKRDPLVAAFYGNSKDSG